MRSKQQQQQKRMHKIKFKLILLFEAAKWTNSFYTIILVITY